MLNIIIAESFEPGNYLAVWKIVIFLIFFGIWAWFGGWLDKDTPLVRTNRTFWNNTYLGLGGLAIMLWLVLPAPFIVGMLLYLAIWLTCIIAYIMHRNARVTVPERIFTLEHFKQIASRQGKREPKQRLVFISANKNELPMPHRQDIEYDGYIVAEELLYDATWRRVSTAEIVPVGDNFQTRYVIDGVLGLADERPRAEAELAIAYLKAVADLDVKDRRRPQNSAFDIRIEGNTVKWKIYTAGSTRGEQMRLERIERAQTLSLDALGFNEAQLQAIEEVVAKGEGIMLVCGAKGAGVTSTLYGILRRHDVFIQNVNTLEKKILTDLDNITQNVVDEHTSDPEVSARQLQSVLRGDPDVVMVGFCDSAEMAQLATETARDGKKLYFGLEAPTTFHCLQQWVKLVVDSEKVSQTLLAITAQKLVRKLCTECREAYSPDPGLLKKLNLPVGKIKQFYRPPAEPEYDKRGKPIICENCQGTGYFGRTAVFETLIINDNLRQLIRDKAPINAIRAQCRKDRMLYLQEQALRRLIDGTTSIQEVLRATTERPAQAPRPGPGADQKKQNGPKTT